MPNQDPTTSTPSHADGNEERYAETDPDRQKIGPIVGFTVSFEHGSAIIPISGQMTIDHTTRIVEIARENRIHFYDLSKATRWSYEIANSGS